MYGQIVYLYAASVKPVPPARRWCRTISTRPGLLSGWRRPSSSGGVRDLPDRAVDRRNEAL